MTGDCNTCRGACLCALNREVSRLKRPLPRRSDGGRILDPENVTPAKKPDGERQERRG